MGLERRDFLKVAGFLAGSLALGRSINRLDTIFQVEWDANPNISFNESRQLALRLKNLEQILPPAPKIPQTKESMNLIAREIVPMLVREGAIDEPRFPQVLESVEFHDEKQILVAGQSNCDTRAEVNFQYENPFSSNYKDFHWIATEAHELVHISQKEANGACTPRTINNTENTAEIVSWEVMAAMVNDKNNLMIFPLVEKLQTVTMAACLTSSMDEGRMGDYERLIMDVYPDPLFYAQIEKHAIFWKGREDERKKNLELYATRPLERVVAAISHNNNLIPNLALPPVYHNEPGLDTPVSEQRGFMVDDLAYFFTNMEMLAKDMRN